MPTVCRSRVRNHSGSSQTFVNLADVMSAETPRRHGAFLLSVLTLLLVIHVHIAENFVQLALAPRGARVRRQADETVSESEPGTSGTKKLSGTKFSKATDADPKPLSYYAGMLTNPPSEEDSEKDMITPTLKFVGYGFLFGLAYLALFIGLNTPGAP